MCCSACEWGAAGCSIEPDCPLNSVFLLRLIEVGLAELLAVFEREGVRLQFGVDLELLVDEGQPRDIAFVRTIDQDHARPGGLATGWAAGLAAGVEFLVVGILNFGREVSLLVEYLLAGEAGPVRAVEPETAADARRPLPFGRDFQFRDHVETSQNSGPFFSPLPRVELLDKRLLDPENEARVIQGHRAHHQSFGEMERARRRERALFLFPFELLKPRAVIRVIRPEQKLPVFGGVVDRDPETVRFRNHVRDPRPEARLNQHPNLIGALQY